MLIGTRTLFVDTPQGTKPVPVRLFLPEQLSGKGDRHYEKWDCRYEIEWPEGTIKSHAQGNDALHALHLAELKIGTELYMSRYHHERKMRWIDLWEGYGFPLPKGARDLLIGHDKQFYGD